MKVNKAICDIGDSWCPNLLHHFFRRIPEARWRETVIARSDISTLAMIFSLVFALSRQKTSITSHELERLTSCALLPAPCSPWQRSRFQVHFPVESGDDGIPREDWVMLKPKFVRVTMPPEFQFQSHATGTSTCSRLRVRQPTTSRCCF